MPFPDTKVDKGTNLVIPAKAGNHVICNLDPRLCEDDEHDE